MVRGFIVTANNKLEIDLHINYWRCTRNKNAIIIDFGIMVLNTADFQKLAIFLPFEQVEIMDLGREMDRNRMTDLIFNRKFTTTHKGEQKHFYTVKAEDMQFGVYEIHESSLTSENLCEGIVAEIVPKPMEMDEIRSENQCYFRFRVKTKFDSAGESFTKSETRASFLYSEIEESERISIRINNPRDITEKMNDFFHFDEKKMQMCDIKSVRLFVIASFNNRIETNPSYGQYTTRKLENELWEGYLGKDVKLRGELICHYWKMTSNVNDMHYSFLCELCEKKSNWLIIIIYIIVLLLLNMVSSFLWELLCEKIFGGI